MTKDTYLEYKKKLDEILGNKYYIYIDFSLSSYAGIFFEIKELHFYFMIEFL